MRSTARTGIVLLATAALFTLDPAWAQEAAPDATSDTQPEENRVEGFLIFGPQYFVDSTNRNSGKFEEFRDVPNAFVLERFDFFWAPNDRTFLSLNVKDVTQRDTQLLFEFGQYDVWKGQVRWSENPRRWTDHAYQLFAQSQQGVFTLVDPLQAAVRAAPASADANGDLEWDPGTKGFIIKDAIAQGAQATDVGHQRKTGGAGVAYTPTRHLTFTLDADRERRKGTMPTTLGVNFSQAQAEVAAPVDFKTDFATVGAEYATRKWNAGVRLSHQDFSTGRPFIRWDNQLFLVDEAVNPNQANPGRMQMSQAVDFDSNQLAVYGGVNLPMHTRIDGSFSEMRTTQDEPFLPMTINSLLTPLPLPTTSYDGEHLTRNIRLNVNSRPTRQFRWAAWFRSYDLDNRSPSLTFGNYVQADNSIPTCSNLATCDANGNGALDDFIARRSLPYSFKRDAVGALFGWTPLDWFSGSISYEREGVDRDFSGVESSDEDIAKLTLDFNPAEWIGARLTFRHQDRKADHYDAEYFDAAFPNGTPAAAESNPGMRRFYWTDRDRDHVLLNVDITPSPNYSIYVEAAYWNNEYTDPNTGLKIGQSYLSTEDRNFDGIPETYDILLAGRTKDRSTSYSVGFATTPIERLRLYFDYTWDTWKYGLETRYRNITGGIGTDDPLDNWGSNVRDDYDTASFGLDLALAAERKWWLALDTSYSKGTGDIETHFVPGGASSSDTPLTAFPQLDTKLTVAQLSVHHEIKKNLGYELRYWYESWKEQNFASDFNQPYMGDPDNDPSSDRGIFLGLDYKNYTNHIVSLMLNYSF
jgi:MtrB/PioB family decaheme-associated outer membrane protein